MAVLALVSACAGGDDDQAAVTATTFPRTTTTRAQRQSRPPTTVAPTTVAPATTLPPVVVPDLGTPVLGAASLTGPADVPPELDQAGRDTVSTLVREYVTRAVAAPVGTGQPADLTGLLSRVLTPRLTPEQRAVLTDEGVPRLTLVKADRFDVTAEALAGPDGSIGIVNCRIDLVLSGVAVDSAQVVTIARRGDLTFAWEPDDTGGGAWRLDSFTLEVDRALPA